MAVENAADRASKHAVTHASRAAGAINVDSEGKATDIKSRGTLNVLQGLRGSMSIDVDGTSPNYVLPDNDGAISISAYGGRVRFVLSDGSMNAGAQDHVINDGERLEFLVGDNDHISATSDDGSTPAVLDISGLGSPRLNVD